MLNGHHMQVRTRAATLPQAINACEAINTAALRLLRLELPIEIRLMGLRMSNFLEVHLEPGQRSISAFVQASHPDQAVGSAAAAEDVAGRALYIQSAPDVFTTCTALLASKGVASLRWLLRLCLLQL